MTPFYRERTIKATRRPHRCEVCRDTIAAGDTALYIAGLNSAYDGIWFGYFHADCRAAENDFNQNVLDWHDGDEWFFIADSGDQDDRDWLREKHPTVFARMFGAESVAA